MSHNNSDKAKNNEVKLIPYEILSAGAEVTDGTSMATPHVSGGVALIIKQCEKEFERTLSEEEIYAQLIRRTNALGNSKRLEGNGFLDLAKE